MEENNVQTVTDIDTALIDLTAKDKTETVVKSLFDKKFLPFITELTFEQITEICKLKHIAKKYGKDNFPEYNKKYPIEDNINLFIDNFLLHMCSHKRKRVTEFLDGLKGEKQEKKSTGLFDFMKK